MNGDFSQKRGCFGGKIQAESDSKAATALNNCLDVIVIQQVGAKSPKEWYFCHPLPLLSPFGAHVVFGAHMSSLSSMHQLPPPLSCHPICALLLANRRRQGLGKESQYCIKQWHIPADMFVCTKGEIEKLSDWSFPMVWTHFERKVSIFFQKHSGLWCDA